MSEYDDLFKDRDNDDIFFAKKKDVPDPNVAFNEIQHEQRINRIILFTYVAVMLLVSLVSMIYTSLKYPDADAVIALVTVIYEPDVYIQDSTNPDYEFEYVLSGTLKNENEFTLPRMWVQYDMYDLDGNLVISQYYDEENIGTNEVFSYNESVFSNTELSDFEYTYGYDESSFFYIIFNLAQVSIAAFICLYVDKTNFKKDWKRTVATPGQSIGLIVGGFAMVYVAMIVSQILLQYVFGVGTSSENENMIGSMFSNNPLNLVLLFLLLCVFTPIVEELVFRKVIYNFFERKLGVIAAIASSGIIFGLMHVISYGDFIQAIPYVLMGSVFGYVYYIGKKNIYITIGVHFINNLLSFVIYFVLVLGLA